LVAFALIVGVHALGVLGLLAHRIAVKQEPQPMIVSVIETSPSVERPAPPVVPQLEPLQLPLAIMPEVITMEEPAPTAITVAAVAVPSQAPPIVAAHEPIVEARFDADYLNNPQPVYPSIARRMREEGLVVLKVKVRADGTVDAVFLQQRSGSMHLDEAALAAVKHWRFVPAKRGNESIESWVLVPIEFDLKA
jgi:protein TonB